jgi:hypothetical protein
MLTLEEWVNGGRYESWFGARPPHQPARYNQRSLSADESPIGAADITGFRRIPGISRAGLAGGGAPDQNDTRIPKEIGYITPAAWQQGQPATAKEDGSAGA